MQHDLSNLQRFVPRKPGKLATSAPGVSGRSDSQRKAHALEKNCVASCWTNCIARCNRALRLTMSVLYDYNNKRVGRSTES